jgi:hypothetical protein
VRVRKVNRYYCDFCTKANLSAFHMRKHEAGCTLNPERVCGMCKMVGSTQRPIPELVALLPDSSPVHLSMTEDDAYWDAQREFSEALKAALPVLRDSTRNCPACIMAALRQAKIPVPLAEGFNFSAECKAIWNAINESQMRNECYA